MVLKTYLRYDAVPNPAKINEKESVIVGCGTTCKEFLKIGSSRCCQFFDSCPEVMVLTAGNKTTSNRKKKWRL